MEVEQDGSNGRRANEVVDPFDDLVLNLLVGRLESQLLQFLNLSLVKLEGDRYNVESADENGRAFGVFGPQFVTLLADSALQLLELDVVPDKPGVVAQSVLS